MAENKKIHTIPTNHSLAIDSRTRMNLTGVVDVSSFSDDKIEIITTMGTLTVKGKKLNVNTLNTDSGELKVTGEVKTLEYSDKGRREGMLTGLFR